jgi:hypothetical protein
MRATHSLCALFYGHNAFAVRSILCAQRIRCALYFMRTTHSLCAFWPAAKKVLTRGGIRSKVTAVGSGNPTTAPQPAGNWLTRPPKRIRPRLPMALTRPRLPMAITRHPAPPVKRVRGKVYRTRNPKGNLRRQKSEAEGRSGGSKNCVRGFAALRSFRPYRAGTAGLRRGGRPPLRGAGSRRRARTAGN